MRSSILSFEHFQHYATLPRSEKLWHGWAAILLVLVAVLGLKVPELVYGKYGYKQETRSTAAVAALSPETQVLFIGSSHVQWGIRPERYSLNVMNLAGPVQNYACAERLVEKHIGRVPNLKVAVIELDEVPLIANTLAALDKDFRPLLELGLSPYDLPTHNVLTKLKAALYPILTLPRVTPIELISNRTVKHPALPTQYFAAGYVYTEAVMAPDYNPKPRLLGYTWAAQDRHMVQQNLQALQRMIDLLRSRGITVVLLRLPHHALYRRNRPAVLRAQVDLIKRSVNRRYSADRQLLIWDLGDAHGFEIHDFFDAEHLNVSGANKLALILDSKLRALCALSRQ